VQQLIRSNANGDFVVRLSMETQTLCFRLPECLNVDLDRRRSSREDAVPLNIETREDS
jgi:hypothetical protein